MDIIWIENEGDFVEKKRFELKEEFITLGQLLKSIDLISSGGMAKWFLTENQVLVNHLVEDRRGRKLYDQDVVEIPANNLLINIIKSE